MTVHRARCEHRWEIKLWKLLSVEYCFVKCYLSVMCLVSNKTSLLQYVLVIQCIITCLVKIYTSGSFHWSQRECCSSWLVIHVMNYFKSSFTYYYFFLNRSEIIPDSSSTFPSNSIPWNISKCISYLINLYMRDENTRLAVKKGQMLSPRYMRPRSHTTRRISLMALLVLQYQCVIPRCYHQSRKIWESRAYTLCILSKEPQHIVVSCPRLRVIKRKK